MSEQTSRQQAAELLDTMSDDDLVAWVEVGDFTSIGDVRLSDDDARRIGEALAAPEVAGYGFSIGLGLGHGSESQNIGSLGSSAASSIGNIEGPRTNQHVPVLRFAIKDVLISGFSL